ncbi:MAG: hypothetical protein KGR26_13340, partial [Cyanobacteria bacterium REEB65]|nr:hypothetical protein [Cyanobacteria bacterium REEB65]
DGSQPYVDSKLVQPSVAAEQRESAKAMASSLAKPGDDKSKGKEKSDDSEVETEQDAEEQRSLLARASRVLDQVEAELKRHAG